MPLCDVKKNSAPFWLQFKRALAVCVHALFVAFGLLPQLARADLSPDDYIALNNLYTSTNGASWVNNTGWGNITQATSCASIFGVTCVEDDGIEHVVRIILPNNKLSGVLSPLAGMSRLVEFRIPSTAGNANANTVTGSIPPINTLTALVIFDVTGNQLTGEIPPISALTNLVSFSVGSNQLTGALPNISGLLALTAFFANNNQLSGEIPGMANVSQLADFVVNNNLLEGSMPSLDSLPALRRWDSSFNRLTGNVPNLDSKAGLQVLRINNNAHSGSMPAPPSPNALLPGLSQLCPNQLSKINNAVWDTATGSAPWHAQCAGVAALTVTPSAGSFGSISPAIPVSVTAGDTASFTVTPNAGYSASVAGTCGGTLSGTTYTTNPITASCTVIASFALPTFTVTSSVNGGNGTITPLGDRTAAPNSTLSYVLAPNPGYGGDVSTTCAGAGSSLVGATFTTAPIVANCTVTAVFVLVDPSQVSARTVPTLGQWALLLLALLVIGVVALRNKHGTAKYL
jgi:hypothetical protein